MFERLRIKNHADFLSGLLFIALGLFGLYEALQYDLGTARRMGAGFFPVILSAILAVLGIAVALTSLGLSQPGETAEAPAEAHEEIDAPERAARLKQAARAVFFVTIALVLFALGLPRLGLVLSVIMLVVVSSFADPNLSWRATVVIALFMAFVSVAVFRWGIGLPFSVWP